MSFYYLTGAQCVMPFPPHVFQADVLIRNGRIERLGSALASLGDAEVINLRGKYLLPGHVCAHTHLYSTLARGMPGPPEPPQNFVQILERVWWRLDRALDEESLYLSALVGALEAAQAGTTCLIDHNASPSFIRGSLNTIARALEEVGVRGVLCYEVTDRRGTKERDEAVEESRAFLDEVKRKQPSFIRGLVGAHASFTLSDETLKLLAGLVGEFQNGLHIHVAEDAYDEVHARANYHCGVIERLAKFGLLTKKTVLAHGVHLTAEQIKTIQQAGSWLVHNPRSNLNNCVGRAPAESFGERVALGTDGIGADMFEESKFAFFWAREASLSANAEAYLRMLGNGQQIVSNLFGVRFGMIEPGAEADLIVLDYRPPTPLTAENFAWHWMFGMTSAHVESVMVEGRFIVRDRKLVTVDSEAVYQTAREVAARLWKRLQSL